MKLTHYMTCNIGRGPMTILRIEDDAGRDMLRVSPNAKTGKVARVSSAEMQEALDKARLMDVEHNITKEIAAQIEAPVLQWMTAQRIDIGSLRWQKNEGKLFRTSSEAKDWDSTRDIAELEDQLSSAPRKKRFMLG